MEQLPDHPRSERTLAWGPVCVVVAVLCIRGGFLFRSTASLQADPDGYRAIARAVRTEQTFARPARNDPQRLVPTAYRPPLYPLLLSLLTDRESTSGESADGVTSGGKSTDDATAHRATASGVAPIRVAVLHFVLGIATALLVLVLARRWQLGRAAWCAVLLVGCDPILLQQSALVMTETLAALLTVAAVLALDQAGRSHRAIWALVAGVVLGGAALCRPTYLPIALLAALWLWWGCGRSRARLVGAGLLLAGTALVVAPWAVRNRYVMGQWIGTTTHGGYTLLLGNNPSFYQYLREAEWGEVWAPSSDDELMETCRAGASDLPPAGTVEAELADDALAKRCALEYIRAEPWMFVRACVYRVGQFWSPWPHARGANESASQRGLRWIVGAWYVVILGAAVVGILLHRRRRTRSPACWTVVVIVGFVAAHTFYWSNLRMRGPVMPLIAVWAAAGLVGWSRRFVSDCRVGGCGDSPPAE